MKKLYILFLVLPVLVFAQSQDQNYIKNTTYKVPTLSSISNPEANQAAVTVQYFDGLGRPIQQVSHKQSNTGKDIIVHTGYDEFGRQTKEYLPYVRSSASLGFDPSGEGNTLGFYSTNNLSLTGNPHFETTGNPYSEKVLEASPLSRVFEQAAPGDPWHKTNGKTIKFDYQTNEDEEVVYFKANTEWSSTFGLYTIALVKDGHYAPNQLYKTITKDENWVIGVNNTTEEFKNKQGQVILKRTYNNSNTHDTYYVYDIYGNLTYVIPPKVDVNQTLTQVILDGLCYQYKYDSRNRLVEKKLPGKQWEFMVYDKLDRVIATGPALSPFTNLTSTGWLITKYDRFNRVVLTGWMPATVTPATRKTTQDARNLQTTNFSETKIATTSNSTVNGVAFRYTNVAWPTSGYHVLSVNYYDNYNFPNAPTTIPTTVESDTVHYNNTRKPIGLATGSYVRVPETSTLYKSEVSYMLYDKKARVLQTRSSNFLGGYTQVDSKLDFSGKTLYTKTRHKRLAADNELLITDTFTYSNQDKLLTHLHQINALAPQLLSKNEYDELGQLIVKKVGGEDLTGATSLQKVDFQYNIRGWLKKINDVDDLQLGTDPQDLFAFKLNYDTAEDLSMGCEPLFNGNISQTYWRTAGDNTQRKYSFVYDQLNRLYSARYSKPESTIPNTNSYNEILSYDKNGNITYLERTGEYDDATTPLIIDELTYTYKTNSPNQISIVKDKSNNPNGFKDGTNQLDDYFYDLNGNMTVDHNKGISSIVYNHLNLPTRITFGTSGNIVYIYNANGVKVRKIVTEGSTTQTTDYLSGFQYINDRLEFFSHAEGYVKSSSIKYNYVFNYTDHLGNIRLSYTQDPATNVLTILEENNYYPFGLKHRNYNMGKKQYEKLESTGGIVITPTNETVYDYKYNGKEWQDELGLNLYDYHARNYDPAIGRWMNMDPHAETYFSLSSYNYAINNPISFIDPDGRDILFWQWKADSRLNSGGTWEQVKYNQLDKKTQKGIKDFASTKIGYDFLSQFANEGDKIGDIEFKNNGKYSKHNLNFQELTDGNVEGNTPRPRDNNVFGPTKNGESGSFIDFYVAVDTKMENSDINFPETIAHEIFLHLDKFLDSYVSAFNNQIPFLNSTEAVYDSFSRNNYKGSQNHLDMAAGKGVKYYQFISQLKRIYNPEQVQKHVNNEKEKNRNHGIFYKKNRN